jgi:hypothetical protein
LTIPIYFEYLLNCLTHALKFEREKVTL